MARPQDWSALGMHSDPTPGDVDTLSSLYQGLRDTETLGNEITSGLNRVLDQSGNGFVGRTAEAVRAKIDGHLKQFIDAIGQSFSVAADATMAFKTALQDVQMKADDALKNAQGLSKDDPQLNGLKAQAHTAQDEYNAAVTTYEHRMKDAQHLIRQPIDAWHLFLKSLGILEIILAIVGAFFGGWIGMLAFGLGMVVFISTLVDFAEGKAGLLDVALAFIGILFPSTKGINVGGLTKSVFNALKNLPKSIGSGLTGLGGALSHILTGGLSFRGIYSGVTALPGLVLRGLNGVANLAIKGLKITIAGLKMLAQTFRADFQMATAYIHTTLGKVGVYAISFGSRFVLSATLPVDFFELGIHAGSAFKMGFGTRLLTPTAHLSQSALGGGLHIGALTANHGGLAGFTGGMPHFETFQPGTLQGFNPGALQGLNTGLGGAQLGGLHGVTVGADVGGANLGSLHAMDLGAHPGAEGQPAHGERRWPGQCGTPHRLRPLHRLPAHLRRSAGTAAHPHGRRRPVRGARPLRPGLRHARPAQRPGDLRYRHRSEHGARRRPELGARRDRPRRGLPRSRHPRAAQHRGRRHLQHSDDAGRHQPPGRCAQRHADHAAHGLPGHGGPDQRRRQAGRGRA